MRTDCTQEEKVRGTDAADVVEGSLRGHPFHQAKCQVAVQQQGTCDVLIK